MADKVNIVRDVISKAYADADLIVKASMTNGTTDLLLRLVRLCMVRGGVTISQFHSRHRVWYNNNRNAQSKGTLNADKNARTNILTKQDTDSKHITWQQAVKLLSIVGCDIKDVAITYYDRTTGEDITVHSSSNYSAELQAREESRRLPSMSDMGPKDL